MQKRLYKKAESYPLTDDSLLFCLCSCALFIPGWADKLRRTRTLHPPRTLRVWRVLFCLWLRAAAYPAGQDRKRQLLPADAGSDCKRNPAARFAARMLGAHSLELGMIRCVDEIREQVRRETGLSLTDAQINERTILNKGCRICEQEYE